jgi:hypothetical protein
LTRLNWLWRLTFVVPCDDIAEMLAGDALCSSLVEMVEHAIEVEVRSPSKTRSIILKFESEGSCEYRGDEPPWFSYLNWSLTRMVKC